MLYDVGLRITYSYANAASGGRHVLYMTPADVPGRQRTITSLLDITPHPDERFARKDFFGNTIVEAAFRAPHDEIAFRLRARVERYAEIPPPDASPRLDGLAREIMAVRSLAPEAPQHFLADSPRVSTRVEFDAYARSQIEPGMSTLAIVEAVGKAIDRDMKFDPDATDVNTPPEEAFARRHGVCQDFSHIMIGCLRAIGVPAGYVSGFLRTDPPAGQPRLEGADAMHAWVRAWCGAKVGWIEYDPTNGMFAGDDHIIVAYGRDYGDVAPVRGVVRIAGGQASTQAVDVVPLG
ncbi:MAG: transglutaminase family protein [Hyphomonadaceae bacterium]|nr:transglutaminase family protein [Hyphomonadaceae bacterium]